MAHPQSKTRFLPIRKRNESELGRYERLRHPSKCNLNEVEELYKYIEGPPNTFLSSTPSIFYTNASFDPAKGCPLYDRNLQTKPGSTNICVSPEFIERMSQPGPFMGTILYVMYDEETKTKIVQKHMSSFIYFPDDSLYIVDTTAHHVGHEAELNTQLTAIFNKDITAVDIPVRIYLRYEFMPFLQETEPIGYCTAWAAGIMESILPHLTEIESMPFQQQIEWFKRFYERLTATPTFGQDTYNKLAMRSHGATRKGGRRTRGRKYRKSRRSLRSYSR